MKDYYSILGVARVATAADIKRAYRRLVQQYHPDINPAPGAQEFIREINEAYDVLGDEVKRREYDYRLSNPFASVEVEEPVRHRDPAYRRRSGYRQPKPTVDVQRELMIRSLPYLKALAWVGIFICCVLVVDYSMQPTDSVETVTAIRKKGLRNNQKLDMLTNTGRIYEIPFEYIPRIYVGQEIIFKESKGLAILITIYTEDEEVYIDNLATLYDNFSFIPVLLAVFSILGISAIGSVETRFNVGIISTFLLIFTLILML
ncbi:MAG TPA: DnaJ domain-containing protein [Cyclobacteriaceae bacterium]|nr:DnaJ domain-containing protein [Cyclobacteriaceae bacterium]HRJ82252.1 DnaJ domain-containing protein [Cyclobacteriaceae bacterium]